MNSRPKVINILGRRIATAIPILVGMICAVFFIAHILPGDPAAMYLSPSLPPSVADAARRSFGLDQPITTQFVTWASHVLTLDFGLSFSTHRPVADLIAEAFPVTLMLGCSAFIVQFVLGITLAAASARKPDRWFDKTISTGSLLLYSIPTFVLGTMLVSFFAFDLRIFPSAQLASFSAGSTTLMGMIADRAMHLVLPVTTIALPGAAGIYRYVRANLRTTLNRQYILVARSNGISESIILWKYALPPALISTITLGGLELGTLLAGTVATETLFALPGMGRLTVSAVLARDYPLLIGCTIISGIVVIVSNTLADVIHTLLDPRTNTA